MKVCNGSGGIGIYVVPKLPKCPVPVQMYHIYRRVRYWNEGMYRYRYVCRTELTKVSGNGSTAGICTVHTRCFTAAPISDFLIGLVCVMENKANSRGEQTNVVLASNYGRIIAAMWNRHRCCRCCCDAAAAADAR